MTHICNTVESIISIPDDIENKEKYLNDTIGIMYNLTKVADKSQEIKIIDR
jgi:hypothetical protein